MHQIAPKLWVGSQADFEELDQFGTEWAIVFAARDPWHRKELGYTGRGAPPDHPEYLFARRGNRLMLNLVDAQDPKYISRKAVDEAMRFIDVRLKLCAEPDNPNAVAIFCNQGGSRAPTLGMLYLASSLPESFEEADAEYRELCPTYAPGVGMNEFAMLHWERYRNRAWAWPRDPKDAIRSILEPMEIPMGTLPPASDTALATAQQIWERFCESMKSDPARAREQLIESLVTALSAAPQQDHANNGTTDSGNPG